MHDVHGDNHLEEISVLCSDTNKVERVPASAMFIFIGALPRTEWLSGVVERDDRGFVLTGPDVMKDGKPPKGWAAGAGPVPVGEQCPRNLRGRRCTSRFGKASGVRSRRRFSGSSVHSSISAQGINGNQRRVTPGSGVRRSSGGPDWWFLAHSEELLITRERLTSSRARQQTQCSSSLRANFMCGVILAART